MDLPSLSKVVPSTSSVASKPLEDPKTYRIPKNNAQPATATLDASPSNIIPTKPKTTHSSDSAKSQRNTTTPAFDLKDLENILNASPGASFAVPGTSGLNTLKDKHIPAMDVPDPSKLVPSTPSVASKQSEVSKTYRIPKYKAQPATATLDASFSLPEASNIVPTKLKTTPPMSKDVRRPSLDSSDSAKSQRNTTIPAFDLKYLENILLNASPGASFAVPGTSGLSTLKDKRTSAMDLPGSSKVVLSTSKEESKPSTSKTVTSSVSSKQLVASKTSLGSKNNAQPATAPPDASFSLPGPSKNLPIVPETTSRMSKDGRRPSLDSSDIAKSVESTTPAWAVPKYLKYIMHASPGASFALPGTSGMSTLKDKGKPTMDIIGPSKVVPSTSKEESKPSIAQTVTSSVPSKQIEASISYRGSKHNAHSATATPDASFSLPGPSKNVPIMPETTRHMSKEVRRPSLDSSDNAKSLHSTMPASSVPKDLQDISKVSTGSSFVVLPGPSTQKMAASDHAKSPRNTTKPAFDLKDLENISAPETSTSNIAGSSSSATLQPSFTDPSKSLPGTSKAAALKSDRSPSDDENCPTKAVLEPAEVKSTLTVSLPLVCHDAMKTAHRMSKDVWRPSLVSSDNAKSLHSTTPVPKNLENILNALPGASFSVPGTSESNTLKDNSKSALDQAGASSKLKDNRQPAIDLAGPSKASPCTSKNESKHTSTKTITASSSNTPGANQSEASKTSRSLKKKSRRRSSVPVDTSIALPGPSSIPSMQETAASDHAKSPETTTKHTSDLKDLENISGAKLLNNRKPAMDLAGPSKALPCTSKNASKHTSTKTAKSIGSASSSNTPGANQSEASKTGRSQKKKSRRRRSPIPDDKSIASPDSSNIPIMQETTASDHAKSPENTTKPTSDLKDLENISKAKLQDKLKSAMDLAGPAKASPCASKNESKHTMTKTVTSKSEGSSSNTPGNNQSEASKTERSRKKKSRRRRSPVSGDTSIALPGPSNIPSM